MEAKPPIPAPQIADSAPITNICSAPSSIMVFVASAMACVPAAHAVTHDKLGPLIPWSIEINPPNILTNDEGIKNGEIRLGPRFSQIMEFFSIFGSPPIPEAEEIPNRSILTSSLKFASSIASLAALMPSWINRSAFLTSLASITSLGLKPTISPAILTENFCASKSSISLIPHLPSTMAENAVSLSFPTLLIIPKPVTTTRFTRSPL